MRKSRESLFAGAVLFAALFVALSITGCAPSPFADDWLPPRELSTSAATWMPSRLAIERADGHTDAAADDQAPLPKPNDVVGDLTLSDAITRALLHNPALASYGYGVRVAEARQVQAGLSPNPRVSYGIENIGPNGDDFLLRHTVRLSQVIELAGKRDKRLHLAGANQRLAGWDYENRRLDVVTQVGQRYVAVVAAQERVALADRTVKIAQGVYDIVDERVKAGVIPPAERDRSAVRVSIERIALDRAKHQLQSARQALASTWGGGKPTFDQVAGNLNELVDTPDIEQLVILAAKHPRVARWADELEQRRRAVALERANGVPDVTAGAGLRHFPDAGEAAGVIELSIPLPFNDRNQGRVLEARYNVGKVRLQQRAAEAAIREELVAALSDQASAKFALTTLNQETLPAAKSALKAAREAFQNGRTDFIDVLDAERTLVDVERSLIDARESFHASVATLEGLTATPLKHSE